MASLTVHILSSFEDIAGECFDTTEVWQEMDAMYV